MIKRYKQFVNESIEDYFDHQVKKSYTRDEIRQLRDDWVDAIMEISENNGGLSFSSLCKRDAADPEKDYKEFQKEMDSKGFPFDLIKEIFSKESDKLIGSIAYDGPDTDIFAEIHQSPLEEKNGEIDTYLYFTVKRLGLDYKKVLLGGPGWSGIDDYPEEAIIRYSYGYHKTKYGQLMMEQLGITQEDFKEYASKGFCIELINNWSQFFYAKMEDFVIIEEDRIVIFTKKLADYLDDSERQKVLLVKDFLLQNFPNKTHWLDPHIDLVSRNAGIEDINKKLTNFLKIYPFIEYDITENEFLIHCESDKRYLMN